MTYETRTLRSGRLARVILSLVAALLAFTWVNSDVADIGMTWDEPPYFASAVRIQDWTGRLLTGPDRAEVLREQQIRDAWDWGRTWNPHPPVYKEVMAATEWLAGDAWGSVRGFRLAPILFFCLLVAAVAWVGAGEWGLLAGGTAAAALLLMPRVLGHAHIAATDIPLTTLWFVATLGTVRFIERGKFWTFAVAALAFGLAMGTKFTGLLVPLPILVWVLVYERRARAGVALLAVGVLALLIAYLANPLAWYTPIEAAADLVRESLDRSEVVPISTYYLGASYRFELPWHHAIVMTLTTVPLGILALAFWGAGSTLSRWRAEPLAGLCLLEIGFFWVLLALPSSPNHDGVRLFLPIFPFLALLAGYGARVIGRLLRKRLESVELRLAGALGVVIFFLPAYLQTVAISPYYLSYYGELAGGIPGAERRGMEMTYWYDAVTPDFLDRLNASLPREAVLATFPSQDYFIGLQGLGALREDIRITDTLPAPFYLIYGRRGMFTPREWDIYRNVRPLLAVNLQGVELVGLYQYRPTDPPPGENPAASSPEAAD